LEEERTRGKPLDEHHEFLGMMAEQVDRLHRVVDDYQRIGRVEPVLRPADINELVKSVVALESFAADGRWAIRVDLSADLSPCEVDRDLLGGALENVIRNAMEAMPKGGTIVVRTERTEGGDVVIAVEDSGEGMDARKAERALDDFFTTKPQGSGLGLAFVRRVAEAHGGEVTLQSRVGIGTVVRLRLSG
jgi:signal transduction histidine kinase